MSCLSILVFTALLSIAPLAEEPRVPALASPAPEGAGNPASIRWHTSYDEALAASRVSKRPVMLFQLLGKLDDALC